MIERRLQGSGRRDPELSQYDYVLINRERGRVGRYAGAIVSAERSRRDRMEDQIRPILETFSLRWLETNG